MIRLVALFLLASFGALAVPIRSAAPLYDPSALNIGLNCQWQPRCIREHTGAKRRALKYVAKYQPPTWRVELCNRNARRGSLRVDWVGFDHCIRNTDLREPPPPASNLPTRKKKQKRVVSERSFTVSSRSN